VVLLDSTDKARDTPSAPSDHPRTTWSRSAGPVATDQPERGKPGPL